MSVGKAQEGPGLGLGRRKNLGTSATSLPAAVPTVVLGVVLSDEGANTGEIIQDAAKTWFAQIIIPTM